MPENSFILSAADQLSFDRLVAALEQKERTAEAAASPGERFSIIVEECGAERIRMTLKPTTPEDEAFVEELCRQMRGVFPGDRNNTRDAVAHIGTVCLEVSPQPVGTDVEVKIRTDGPDGWFTENRIRSYHPPPRDRSKTGEAIPATCRKAQPETAAAPTSPGKKQKKRRGYREGWEGVADDIIKLRDENTSPSTWGTIGKRYPDFSMSTLARWYKKRKETLKPL